MPPRENTAGAENPISVLEQIIGCQGGSQPAEEDRISIGTKEYMANKQSVYPATRPSNAMTSSEGRTSAESEGSRLLHREVADEVAPPPLLRFSGRQSNPLVSFEQILGRWGFRLIFDWPPHCDQSTARKASRSKHSTCTPDTAVPNKPWEQNGTVSMHSARKHVSMAAWRERTVSSKPGMVLAAWLITLTNHA